MQFNLSNQLNHATSLLDLLLSQRRHVTGLDDNRDIGETTLSKELGVTSSEQVDYRNGITGGLGEVLLARLGGDKSPQLVEVEGGLPELVVGLVEVSHTNLSEVTGMVLVHVGPVVVLTSGQTTTTGMLAVLSDTTVTGTDVTTVLSRLGESGRHGSSG